VTNSFGTRNFVQPMGTFKFPMGSRQVLNMFPRFSMCSPRMFSIAPRFNPICLAQSPPLRTCTCGPKGEALHLFTLGSLHSFNFFFCNGPIKLAHCRKQKVGVVRHPQLINLKHDKTANLLEVDSKPEFFKINIL